MAPTPASLPDSHNVVPVEVSVLPTGHLTHPDRWLFEDGEEDIMQARRKYPDFSFLIEHHSGRKDLNLVPPVIRQLFDIVEPSIPKDASDLLREGPVDPSTISTVIFSHLHFDHVGDCTRFPHAAILAGPGSRAASAPGWPAVPASPFASAPLDHPGYRELGDGASSHPLLATFDGVHDFFGDGSFLLLSTPGHMPGHLGALALTGRDEWVFMGGDCCHHRSLLRGTRPMSVTRGPTPAGGFHRDPAAAMSTIENIRALEVTGDVLVALAHDDYLDGWIPKYPRRVNGWKLSREMREANAI